MSRINTKLPPSILHRNQMKPKKLTVIDKLLRDLPNSSSSDSDSSSGSSLDSDPSLVAGAKMTNESLNSDPAQNVDTITISAAQQKPQLHNRDADASNNSAISASSKNDDSAMNPNAKGSNSNTAQDDYNAQPLRVEFYGFPKHVMDSLPKETVQNDADEEETSDKNTTELVAKDADASKSAAISSEIDGEDSTIKCNANKRPNANASDSNTAHPTQKVHPITISAAQKGKIHCPKLSSIVSRPVSIQIFDADGIKAPITIDIDDEDSIIKPNANKSNRASSNNKKDIAIEKIGGDDFAIKPNANKSNTDSSNDNKDTTNEDTAQNEADDEDSSGGNTAKQVPSLVEKKEQSTILRLKQVLNETEGK